ncbi:Pal1 cell morphology protein-domain-containing protein [Thelephora terrestris]|uniref:Pal1 cell morphology protein-domain-containing protein n=1 Tax=Thelephora terrestris TaxID=56493 RepID=A0A9P6HIN1_9AGAM|nr:Pal1 cell morphology protein-domain-containing protein [Thelephora terrestris]
MPVQTQTRNQPVPTSDPFGDQNPIRLISPKTSSKRDAALDNHRETTNTRGQDPHRTKPIRSQTQQNVGNGRPQAPPRRSLSQDSTPAPPVPEKSKSKRSGKKGSTHADVIDRLDFTGVGPMFHHDGPFDACAPSRNRHRTKAPMAAWSEQTKQAIEEDFKAKDSPRPEPARKHVDAIAQAWGIHEPEPFEDFSAGGGQSSDYRPYYPSQSRRSEEAPRRREAAPRRTALPPPQPIFVPGADAEFIPHSEPSPPLSPGNGAGMKRSRSLMQRFRRMRENPNMPMNNGDDVQNTYESGGSGRPNHKSQNSFAGRLVGGAIKEQLPSPREEDTYDADETAKYKNLPRLPEIDRTDSGEAGYFEQQGDGLGRKMSLIQRVGEVVRGRK